MSVNRARPHLFIVPEDDACREVVNGFHLALGAPRQIQVESVAGGWIPVRDRVLWEHLPRLEGNPHRHVLMVVDFDGRAERYDDMIREIPEHLRDRVFVMGSWNDPEQLSTALKAHGEAIGRSLGEACREGQPGDWSHELLRHNASERARMDAAMGWIRNMAG